MNSPQIKRESRDFFAKLGAHIALLRKAKGMTQAELAHPDQAEQDIWDFYGRSCGDDTSEAIAQSAALPQSHAACGKVAETIQDKAALCDPNHRCVGAAALLVDRHLTKQGPVLP